MKPPYDPEHPEQIVQHGQGAVVARCGRHFQGPPRRLGRDEAARELADDLNAHRATYVTGATA